MKKIFPPEIEIFRRKISSPQKKMINLLQETKKKVEEKNLLSRFPEFDRRSIFAAALYEKLAAEANQFVPAENILKSEANIGLLGREDECECLSELFFHASSWNNSRCLRKSLLRNGSWERILLRG